MRFPRHVGFIPDGNRRWATAHGLPKEDGYAHGLAPALQLFEHCSELGMEEVSVYGFTQGTRMKVNLLVNYGWQWDLDGPARGALRSADFTRIDLIVRWGGARRLSGFLPVQSVYADFFFIDELWPDFRPIHLTQALTWFNRQDRTLGG